jgi:dienelactone hydrolase
MKKITLFLSIILSLQGCATAQFQVEDYSRSAVIQDTPRIKDRHIPPRLGLGDMRPQIPAFDGRGLLIASWTPQANVKQALTFVIAHGGHGIGGTNWQTARRLRDEFGANVLVLDSYWSRGMEQNWSRGHKADATVRTFDLIAAGRWLAQQGVDPTKTYVVGDSQGGWTVLKAFTNDTKIAELIKPLYRAGISLYPVCDEPGLAPYHSPVLIMTGGRDETTPVSRCPGKVTATAHRHVHFPEGTHSWDLASHGALNPPVDGFCKRSTNPANFGMCRNDAITEKMYQEIKTFVAQ